MCITKCEWGCISESRNGQLLHFHSGFVQEGVQRKANWLDGKWQDVIWMAVLDEDWEASKKERELLKIVP